jgi:salicylate hydroxylase
VAERRTVVIAGAGIGGLTAALALSDAGFRAIVCERAETMSELGAGIQLSPNAGRVLAGLGLDEAIAAEAIEPGAIEVRSGTTGHVLVSIPMGRFRERYGFPYRVIHRADLQKILVAAARRRSDISIRLATTVGDVAPQAGGHLVRVKGAGRSDVVPAAAVIGADGVWSSLRERVAGAATAEATGRTAWRALVSLDNAPAALPTDRVGLWLGHDAHLVHYPVARGAAINLVAIVEEKWDRKSWSSPGDRVWLAERFARWPPDVRRIIDAPFGWQKFPIAAVDPAKPWVNGPYALLGDAAHAMAPFLGQGAAMAIEDAAALARALGGSSDVAAALQMYEKERKERVARVTVEARRTGEAYHFAPPLATIRDWALKLGGARLVFWRNDWIYRWVAE